MVVLDSDSVMESHFRCFHSFEIGCKYNKSFSHKKGDSPFLRISF